MKWKKKQLWAQKRESPAMSNVGSAVNDLTPLSAIDAAYGHPIHYKCEVGELTLTSFLFSLFSDALIRT